MTESATNAELGSEVHAGVVDDDAVDVARQVDAQRLPDGTRHVDVGERVLDRVGDRRVRRAGAVGVTEHRPAGHR